MADAQREQMADEIRKALSRRRFLQAGAVGGAALVATACGASGGAGGGASGSATPSPKTQSDKSDSEKVVNWSTWVAYIDVDEKTGKRPTVEEFTAKTGIKVNYNEDVNDNNEFYAKVRPQLEQGQDIGRDIVVLTDWMAAIWIRNAYAQQIDKAVDVNSKNLIPSLQNVSFDPGRQFTQPWQSGYGGLGWNSELLKKLTGKSEMKSVEDLWDPALKGRVTVLSEMRDTIGVIMASQGKDPSNFTDDDFNAANAELQKQIDSGQIRQVTGNDYLAALENRDVVAAIAWSGDVLGLGEGYGFAIPESGGTLWTDNMLIPAMAAHKKNAETLMNYYYDPVVAAKVAAFVQYICPVEGAKEAMAKIDPTLVDNPFIFPTDADLQKVKVFMTLSPEQQNTYEAAFQETIGA